MTENDNKTQNQNKPQSKGKKVLKVILNTAINVLIVLVLIVSLLIAVMALTSKANGISTFFGYTIQPIQSDSMKGGSPDGYPSGDFEAGDLMIAKATDFDNNLEYSLGDIVTFRTRDSATGEEILISHRIVDVIKNETGILTYQTQGDNRETSPAPDQKEPDEYITAFNIGSVFYSASYQGTILKGWGRVLDFLQSQKGFFLVVLLPMIIFFMYELIRVVMNAMNYKKAKADEEKDEAVKAAVAQALAGNNSADPNNTAQAGGMTEEEMEQFRQFQEFQKMQKTQQNGSGATEEVEGSKSAEPEDTNSPE